jgi:hypothetical protein
VVFLSRKPAAEELKPVLAVNPKTLQEREGKTWLLRLKREGEHDQLEALEVKKGRSLGDLVEISGAGLKSGDRVVLESGPKLAGGARVTVSAKP